MTKADGRIGRWIRLAAGIAVLVWGAMGPAPAAAGDGAPALAAGDVSEGVKAIPDGVFEIDVGASGDDGLYFGIILTEACFWRPDGMPSCVDGTVLRLREENEAGGFDGAPVRLLGVWDKGNEEENVQAARLLREDPRVAGVLGPHTSGPARAVIRDMPEGYEGPAFFSSTATGDGLVSPDGWFFSALWPDTAQARAMARYLADSRGLKRGAVVVEEHSAYSKDLGRAFREAFAAAGGGEVREIVLPSSSDDDLEMEDFAGEIEKIKTDGDQFVYVPCSAQHIAMFVRQAGRSGLAPDVILCGGETWDHADVYGGGGRRLEGSLFTSPFAHDPDRVNEGLDAFKRGMALSQADVRNINLDTMLSYDTAHMALASARAGDTTRAGLRRGWFQLRDVPLITGDTSVGESGLIRRDMYLLRIEALADGYAAEFLENIPVE